MEPEISFITKLALLAPAIVSQRTQVIVDDLTVSYVYVPCLRGRADAGAATAGV